MAKGHGLSDDHLEMIRSVLNPYRGKIDRVGLFGSRATGQWKEYSDIDLVLHGKLTEGDVDRMWTLFQDSLLPMNVDVVCYDLINYPPLKKHIDQYEVALVLEDVKV
jgi:predicted nucleotidyltransferase